MNQLDEIPMEALIAEDGMPVSAGQAAVVGLKTKSEAVISSWDPKPWYEEVMTMSAQSPVPPPVPGPISTRFPDLDEAALAEMGLMRNQITTEAGIEYYLWRHVGPGKDDFKLIRRMFVADPDPTGKATGVRMINMPDFWSMVGYPEEWGPDGINAGPMTPQQYADAARARIKALTGG